MKTCTIFGNLTSDRASENYPIVQIFDECFEADKKRQEDKQIVTAGKYDSSFGDTCKFCEKTYEEELQEK